MANDMSETTDIDLSNSLHVETDFTMMALILGAFSGATVVGAIWLAVAVLF